jgi:hypothetical protein
VIDRGEIRVVELAPKWAAKGPKTLRILRSELHRWWKSKMRKAIVEAEPGVFKVS